MRSTRRPDALDSRRKVLNSRVEIDVGLVSTKGINQLLSKLLLGLRARHKPSLAVRLELTSDRTGGQRRWVRRCRCGRSYPTRNAITGLSFGLFRCQLIDTREL